MCIETNLTVEEEKLWKNAFKTFNYLFEAFMDQDYESAKLEMQELDFTIQRLQELKSKRERRQRLIQLIKDMQKRGINIQLGTRSSFLKNIAKNADEKNHNDSKIQKKRQQA